MHFEDDTASDLAFNDLAGKFVRLLPGMCGRHGGKLSAVEVACEPLAYRGIYDFAGSGLVSRARDAALEVILGKGLRSPPPATMFLHRKLLGTFLICARLRAAINVRSLIEPFL